MIEAREKSYILVNIYEGHQKGLRTTVRIPLPSSETYDYHDTLRGNEEDHDELVVARLIFEENENVFSVLIITETADGQVRRVVTCACYNEDGWVFPDVGEF